MFQIPVNFPDNNKRITHIWTLPDFDECGSNPCQHGGNCTDHFAGFTCTCVPGYPGLHCETSTHLTQWSVMGLLVIQIKYGLPYCATCPSMSTDPGTLNLGTRRSRVPGWWDPGSVWILEQVTQFWQNILNLSYSTGSWKSILIPPYWHFVSEGGGVSSSWKWKPVIRNPAHSPLLLLHSMALAAIHGKTEFNKFCCGYHRHSQLTTLATSTLLLVCTVLCVFRCWMLPTGMRRQGNEVCLLFDREVDTADSLLLPANQWYTFTFFGPD